jgi:hypothetical protein
MLADEVFALAAQAFESAVDSEGMIDLRVVRTLAWLHSYRCRPPRTTTRTCTPPLSCSPCWPRSHPMRYHTSYAASQLQTPPSLPAQRSTSRPRSTDKRSSIAAGRSTPRPGTMSGSRHCSGSGPVLWFKYQQDGDPADLDELIDADKAVVELTTAEHPKHTSTSSELCIALRERYDRTGDRTDLDEAVRFGRVSIESLPAGHPARTQTRPTSPRRWVSGSSCDRICRTWMSRSA